MDLLNGFAKIMELRGIRPLWADHIDADAQHPLLTLCVSAIYLVYKKGLNIVYFGIHLILFCFPESKYGCRLFKQLLGP